MIGTVLTRVHLRRSLRCSYDTPKRSRLGNLSPIIDMEKYRNLWIDRNKESDPHGNDIYLAIIFNSPQFLNYSAIWCGFSWLDYSSMIAVYSPMTTAEDMILSWPKS